MRLTTFRPNPIATFDTTVGTIKCEIYLEQMPITASNFIDLANTGFCVCSHAPALCRARSPVPGQATAITFAELAVSVRATHTSSTLLSQTMASISIA